MAKKAGKFRKGFAAAAREELEREAEQKRLHDKHKIKDEHIVVVEKDNTFKFTLRILEQLTRLTATITVLVLAAIGIISLLYPEVRKELIDVLQVIMEQAKDMAGM